uniref:AIR9-like A9 domain-containing protein n=1 Tax=Aegilops tauschii subsp. strangulata TaxID=200361 RepID=A0A452XW43_AEGTS
MHPVESGVSENLEGAKNEYAAAEYDPLPAVDGLRITGEAFPGRELQVSGYSINGTTSCNFEWVRYLEDGLQKFIEGARQPTYLVTADDVDTILAVEVQPLDNRERKGGIVKVYANEERKIPCGEFAEIIFASCIDVVNFPVQIAHVLFQLMMYLSSMPPLKNSSNNVNSAMLLFECKKRIFKEPSCIFLSTESLSVQILKLRSLSSKPFQLAMCLMKFFCLRFRF